MAEYKPAFLADMLKESLRQGITPSLTISSNSMSPLLRCGDRVGLQMLDPASAQPGQIITFSNSNDPDDLITHRVAGTALNNGEAKIATYGDRTLLFDSPVAHEDVLGIVTWRRRNGRFLNLMSGQGARLSKKLTQRSRESLKRATGLQPNIHELDNVKIYKSNQLCLRYKKKMIVRILSRANYLWASLLTLFTEYSPNSGREE